ncbi:MAG TPA: alpha/beta hydrolase [Methylomirabilota bacterium]|nr:alpha/beta hydrolase [Methylomirabilota bacterium]
MTTLRLGCEHARHRLFAASGLTLHALEWGTPGRPALCFLHGGSAHAHWFDLVAPAFADRYHVISLDQRGHGESGWASPAAYATEDFVEDLRQVMQALAWRRAVVVGHSMGGHNALAFAAWHSELVRGLVVVDSRPAIPAERLERMHRRGQRALRLHATPEAAVTAFRLLPPETVAPPALLAHLARAGIVRRDGGWRYRFDPDTNRTRRPADIRTLLAGIAVPTLIVRAELSPVLPRDLAERMRAELPRAELVEIPGTHHHLVLDAPDAFVRVLERYLRGLD